MYNCVIYKATNLVNGKVYIGQTISWPSRIDEHFKAKDNLKFHCALRKYGRDAFLWEVLHTLSTDSRSCAKHWMDAMEIAEINLQHSYWVDYPDHGYNLTSGGQNGGNMGEEWAKRQKEGAQRISKDPDWKRNQKEGAQRTAQNPEWRQKIRDAQRTDEFRKLKSEQSTERWSRPEYRERVGGRIGAVNKLKLIYFSSDGRVMLCCRTKAYCLRKKGTDWTLLGGSFAVLTPKLDIQCPIPQINTLAGQWRSLPTIELSKRL